MDIRSMGERFQAIGNVLVHDMLYEYECRVSPGLPSTLGPNNYKDTKP
jgi:hypothetical protein